MSKIIEITQAQEERVITLYEICKVMDKRHTNSKVLAEEIQAKEGFGTVLNISIVYNNKGQTTKTYSYTKKQALMIGARLDSSNIIKLVNKLEQTTQNFQIPQSFSEALRLAADLDEQNKKLECKLEEKDKVILAVADLNIKVGEVSFSNFAKNLAIENMGRNNIIKFCKARGYLMDNLEPYQPYVKRGYFVRKPSKEKINGKVRYTTFLTPRGTVWLTKNIKAEYEIEEEVA